MRTRPLSLVVLLCFLGFGLSCGSSNGPRQLQSISISAVLNDADVTFVATGTYNRAPITVTPLPVTWYIGPPPDGYQLNTQPFVERCTPLAPSVSAFAPANPNAPNSGPISGIKMVTASAGPACPTA